MRDSLQMADGTDKLQCPPWSEEEKLTRTPGATDVGGRTKIFGLMSPLSRASQFRQWTTPFFMAATNSQAVRRTNRLLGYAPNVSYTERWGFPDASSALAVVLG